MLRTARLVALLAAVGAALVVGSDRSAAQQRVTVAVGDIWFCAPSFEGSVFTTSVSVGDTVVWDFSGASLPHTTTGCGVSCESPTSTPLWDSGVVSDGGVFRFTFTQPGTYRYQCRIHTTLQRGVIVVQAATQEPITPRPGTSTPVAEQAPRESAASATPPSVLVSGVPRTGQGPETGSSSWELLAGLALTGAMLFGLGALVYGLSIQQGRGRG